MIDVTSFPLTPNQRKEVKEYMNKHNVTENEARYGLGYVTGDLSQVSIRVTDDLQQESIRKAFIKVREENPNVELSYQTMDFWVDAVMKHAIPKPNSKCVRKWIENIGMLCFEPSIFPPPVKLPFEIKYKYRKEN